MDDGGRRVFVGVSGSPASLAALRLAVTHARRTAADLHAVLAWTPPGGEVGPRSAPPQELVDVWVDLAWQRLVGAFEEGLGGLPEDVDVRSHVVRGRPGPVLAARACRSDDVLVIGSGAARRTSVGRLHRLGSRPVHGYCTAVCRCTLVVAPPPPLAVLSAGPLRWALRHLPA
jgi:nucleotide-binding universal stress UspA family protein